MNVISLCQELIRFPSVTPADSDIMNYLVSILEPRGFTCHLLPHTDDRGQTIHNLYARRGTSSPNLCFAGHVDVVPIGAEELWLHPPFSGNIYNGNIWGRGAVDMKGAIASFILATENLSHKGSISLLITGDEEGLATHGTIKVIEWLKERNETIDFCIVGEPTSDKVLGDTLKIGRRGSLSGTLTVTGVQGHVAYPNKAENPIPNMIKLLSVLDGCVLDNGYKNFQPSNLEITSIDTGGTADNIIPATISASFNVRYNPTYNRTSLTQHLQKWLDTAGIHYKVDFKGGAEPFLTENHAALALMTQAIIEKTKVIPEYLTSGGTSDARFIRMVAPVIEFGLLNSLAHKVNEQVATQDLEDLVVIYRRFIDLYFTTQP